MILYISITTRIHIHVHGTKDLQSTTPVLKAGHPVSYSSIVCSFVSLGGEYQSSATTGWVAPARQQCLHSYSVYYSEVCINDESVWHLSSVSLPLVEDTHGSFESL